MYAGVVATRGGRALGLVLGALIVVLAGCGSPAGPLIAGPPTGDPPAEVLPVDSAPEGWRTEYFRGGAFLVPKDWGYAQDPGSTWCAGYPDGQPGPELLDPYVSLGDPDITPAIACDELPESLITEHVAVQKVRPDARYRPYNEEQRGRWWIVTAVQGIVLTAYSEDVERARRIATSLAVDPPGAPCAPTVALKPGERPRPFVVGSLEGEVGAVVVCQYDPTDGVFERVARPDAARGRALVETIASAPVRAVSPCGGAGEPELVLNVRLENARAVRTLQLRAGRCETGADGYWGGYDDGNDVRALTRDACQAVLTPPVRLQGASEAIAESCLS